MEDEGNRQVSQKLKALEQSQKQLTTIIIGGTHDYGSHGLKCLMGLRPDGGGMSYAPCGTCPVVRTTLGRDMMFGAVISS